MGSTLRPVEELVASMARWLPHQGPIKEFIHHNTLHAFQHFPFHEGCLRASRLYGSWAFFPLAHYRELYQAGLISDQALLEVLQTSSAPFAALLRHHSATALESLKSLLLDDSHEDYAPQPGIAATGLRSQWARVHKLNLDRWSHPILFRLLGQYLDQGVAMWGAPHPESSLFRFVADLARDSLLPLLPFSAKDVRPYLELPPAQVIKQVLERFLGPKRPGLYERYLLEMSLAHPGWSGMVRELELHPDSLVESRKVSLLDFCALELIAELHFVSSHLGPNFAPLETAMDPAPYDPDYQLVETAAEQMAWFWQQAYERTYRHHFLRQLRVGPGERPAKETVVIQAYFCLDDREGSLRRHLEDSDCAVETYGFAGFFGVDCVFQGIDDAFPSKHCPAPLHPRHRIREHRSDSRRDAKSLRLREVHDDSHTLVRGFVLSQTLGLWAAVRLALSIFRPSLNPLATSSLAKVDSQSTLAIHRSSDQRDEEGFLSGYSDDEMADRVGNLLRASGLIAEGPASLIVFVGHGASSVNNPYFAAYDCGACSGKGGGPNARAIALMANRPEVRAILAKRGVPLPDDIWFLGALHDTTRDEMQYFDLDLVPKSHQALVQRFRGAMEKAVGLNARERCRRFANISPKIDPRDAILAVRRRSVSIFEPRPELNHATNAACIVGRRRRTLGLDLNRRCFLNSYDPTIDPSGEILSSLLSAVVPVCAGINLEYYFSRMDPLRYGAGSKLPHNIQALIGVINGTEGDLLTGLPTQMTEVHDPFRLLFLVEQTPRIALKAALANPQVEQWVRNGWIQYLSLNPEDGGVFEFCAGQMCPVDQMMGDDKMMGDAPLTGDGQMTGDDQSVGDSQTTLDGQVGASSGPYPGPETVPEGPTVGCLSVEEL
jgi:uncharacterized protein YbcC (UPF0753/DUF2309 family)